VIKAMPLRPVEFHILLALAAEERHGYGLLQEVAVLTEGDLQLEPGTLYRALHRMLKDGWVAESAWGADWFTLSKVTLSWCIIVYGLAASVLPVWLLLAPRDYLSTFMKVGTIILLAIGILVAQPIMQAPAVSSFASSGTGPVFAGSQLPFLLNNIARGALIEPNALLDRLKRGDIFACLDTYDEEPLIASDPLRSLPNVFLTAHIAGGSPDNYAAAALEVVRKVAAHLAGEATQSISSERLRTMS